MRLPISYDFSLAGSGCCDVVVAVTVPTAFEGVSGLSSLVAFSLLAVAASSLFGTISVEALVADAVDSCANFEAIPIDLVGDFLQGFVCFGPSGVSMFRSGVPK